MYKILSPDSYQVTPWKNGKGETVELAINPGGTLTDFQWRISIATVSEDGVFSNFSGLRRDLFLIEGKGISLTHDNEQTDVLDELLSVATFDGGSTTVGKLKAGTIKDLNLMTATGKYQVSTASLIAAQHYPLPSEDLCFVYSHEHDVVFRKGNSNVVLPQGHLLQAENGLSGYAVTGKRLLIIQLKSV
ncbi:HutD family protein [Thalassotalea sp. M1531]|uniref:HutD family protein n=1 Tax=Thalassotalea algicola TaxID=2716224 RepID=A0A7Y0Q6F2_9GAMM|nr:HutD family protein [Thalassotalea algicola]NMP31954.1 HutD family protein [Thalassotalea algicola]